MLEDLVQGDEEYDGKCNRWELWSREVWERSRLRLFVQRVRQDTNAGKGWKTTVAR